MKKEMLEIISAEARRKLEDQLNAVDSTDQKIGSILGFVGVVLVLAFNSKPNQSCSLLFYLLSQISFVVSILILFFGYHSIRLKTGLSIKGYLEETIELECEEDLTVFIEDQVKYFKDAINTNNYLIKQKNIYLAYGVLLLLIGLVSYTVSTLI
ncbi:hypothetical protein KJ830_09905 [bacterium]|nr:hypothetical protein [bacterium]